MASINAGTLSSIPFHKIESVNLREPQDVYTLTIGGTASPVPSINLNASIHNAEDGSAKPVMPVLKLFEDTNKDGKLTASGTNADKLVSTVDSNSIFNDGPINLAAHPGKYFAVIDRPSSFLANDVVTSYQIDFSATEFHQPSNLVPVKLPLGNIGSSNLEKTFNGKTSNSNTSDVFSLNLQSGKAATITLNGLDLTGDVDLRIIQDNGDRIVQSNEIVAISNKGIGGLESITITKPGNYLVQAYQFSGNTQYDLKITTDDILSGSNLVGVRVATAKGGPLNGNSRDSLLVGKWHQDILRGHAGSDTLLGCGGKDFLVGGRDNDYLYGGQGRDIATGGAGEDTFILARTAGRDTFKDFQVGQDCLGLANNLTYDQIELIQQTRGTLVKAGGESLAFLQGVDRSQLSESSFVQVDMAKLTANMPAGLIRF